MRTEDLITELASRAAPVKVLPAPAVRLAAWSALAIGCAAAGMIVFGTRPDVILLLGAPEFVRTAIVAAGTVMVAAAGALVLAIPGAERSPALRGTTVALVALWAILLVVAVIHAGHGLAAVADWPVCFLRVLAIGSVPAVVLIRMLRRAAPLRQAWASGLATIAAIATGALAIQFICPLSDPGHALLGHFGPVVAIGGLAAAAARRLLR